METKDFFKRINWNDLVSQKLSLLHVIDINIPAIEKYKDDLIAILDLLDNMQDFAVDELEFSEKEVFNFNDKDYENN